MTIVNSYNGMEIVRIIATPEPNGGWSAVDPYDGLLLIAEKKPEHLLLRMANLMREMATKHGARLPNSLWIIFMDRREKSVHDQLKHNLTYGFEEILMPNHQWDPAWKAMV